MQLQEEGFSPCCPLHMLMGGNLWVLPDPSHPLFPLIHRSYWAVGLWGAVTPAVIGWSPPALPPRHLRVPAAHPPSRGPRRSGSSRPTIPVAGMRSWCYGSCPATCSTCGQSCWASHSWLVSPHLSLLLDGMRGWWGARRHAFGEAGKRILWLTIFF